MAAVSTYINCARQTREAFEFYRSVFKTEFVGQTMTFGQVPQDPAHPLADSDKDLIMHIALPTIGGHVLHGTDAPESMGFHLKPGDNIHIMLEPDTREEADRLYTALSAGSNVTMPMQDQFWGDYFGSLTDKFGINWMINHHTTPNN